MRTLALDPATGDLLLTAGRLTLVEGVDALRQRIQGRLSLWAGEYFADTTVGVPFLRFLGLKNADDFAAQTLRRAVESCPGVKSVDDFAFTRGADRSAMVSFRARMTDGRVVEDSGFRLGAP